MLQQKKKKPVWSMFIIIIIYYATIEWTNERITVCRRSSSNSNSNDLFFFILKPIKTMNIVKIKIQVYYMNFFLFCFSSFLNRSKLKLVYIIIWHTEISFFLLFDKIKKRRFDDERIVIVLFFLWILRNNIKWMNE